MDVYSWEDHLSMVDFPAMLAMAGGYRSHWHHTRVNFTSIRQRYQKYVHLPSGNLLL